MSDVALFHSRLKELREARNMTQEQLAKAIGEKQSTLAGWEGGRGFPRYTTLFKLAEYLEVSLDYLAGRSDVPTIAAQTDGKLIISKHEKTLIVNYRGLSAVEQRMVCKLLDASPLE